MTKEIQTTISSEQKALLTQFFPVENGMQRIVLPRIGFYSQDQTEGKGKAMKVVTEAGTFYTEKESVNDEGEKIWIKEEIGPSIECKIIFQRKQLKYYDESTETYTSSSIYDNDDETVVLWLNKSEIDRGTPAELKARPEYKYEKDGKTKSKLEENRILYVIYQDDLYQMNLRGSSMYSWLTYARKIVPASSVLTSITSEPKEKGTIAWNQMVFNKVRDLDTEEASDVINKVTEIVSYIKKEKDFYGAPKSNEDTNLDEF